MAELRIEIDRIDEDLIALFAERLGYIHRAAELKKGLGLPADIPERVAEVVANAGRMAEERGLEPSLYGDIWMRIVQAAIAEEKKRLGEDLD
jgi:chorismate mutase-like protein